MYMSTSRGDGTCMQDAIQMHKKREEKLSVQISRKPNHSKDRVKGKKKPKTILACERNLHVPVEQTDNGHVHKSCSEELQDRTPYKHSTESRQCSTPKECFFHSSFSHKYVW